MNYTLVVQQVAAHAAALLALDATLCYGVECRRHSTCARYLAIDGVLGTRKFIDTCQTGRYFPLFVDTMPLGEPDHG